MAVLSAHAALGREWDFVVIAGLQEGLWLQHCPRGGVLGTQQLLDIVDGVGDVRGMSATAPLLAEERRLLVAALGQARHRVLVTAVDSDNGDEALLPSTFFEELAALAGGTDPDADESPVHAPAVLSPAALVGRLRSVVCAPTARSRKPIGFVRQRNWRGWRKWACRAPTRRSGTPARSCPLPSRCGRATTTSSRCRRRRCRP